MKLSQNLKEKPLFGGPAFDTSQNSHSRGGENKFLLESTKRQQAEMIIKNLEQIKGVPDPSNATPTDQTTSKVSNKPLQRNYEAKRAEVSEVVQATHAQLGQITQMINKIIDRNSDISTGSKPKLTHDYASSREHLNYDLSNINNGPSQFVKSDSNSNQERENFRKQSEAVKRKNKEMQIEDASKEAYLTNQTGSKQLTDNIHTSPSGFGTSAYLVANDDYPDKQNTSYETKKENLSSIRGDQSKGLISPTGDAIFEFENSVLQTRNNKRESVDRREPVETVGSQYTNTESLATEEEEKHNMEKNSISDYDDNKNQPSKDKIVASLYQRLAQRFPPDQLEVEAMDAFDEEDNPAEYRPEAYYSDYNQDVVLEAVSEHTLESENHSDSLGREDAENNRRKLLEMLELIQSDHIVPKQVNVKLVDLLQKKGFNIETYLQLYYSQQAQNQVSNEKYKSQQQKVTNEKLKHENRVSTEPFEIVINNEEPKNSLNKENKWSSRDSVEGVKKKRQEKQKRNDVQGSTKTAENSDEIKQRSEMEALEKHLQALQDAEEEILNSYAELDKFHKEPQQPVVRTNYVQPNSIPQHQRVNIKSETIASSQDSLAQQVLSGKNTYKKDQVSVNLSDKEGNTPRSQKKETKTPTSSLARMYINRSRSKVQEPEADATHSSVKRNTEENKAASSTCSLEQKDTTPKFQALNTESKDKVVQLNKVHEVALAKRPDRQIKTTKISKAPLTLKDFREMATRKTQNRGSKNPQVNENVQQLSKTQKMSSSSNPYSTPKTLSSHYSWESLANSAKMRDEKVFAMTPSQDYLILDRYQLIDNPQIKVLNSKAWAEFLGVVAREEQEEFDQIMQTKPNFTIADDTVYRKNMNWLAEKKRTLQERKEKLEKEELDKCTFWPNLKRGDDGELYYSPPSKFLEGKHQLSVQATQMNSRSMRSNRTPNRSRSGSRERSGFASYSELHEHRKNLQNYTEKKFNFAGIITTRFLAQKSPVKPTSPSSVKLV